MTTVAIIGASRGIGFEFVRQYRAAGARVIATARSDDALKKLEAAGAQAHRLDVLDAPAIAKLGKSLAGEKIDVLIGNAGVMGIRTQGIAPTAPEDFDFVMRTNVLAAMHIIPAFAEAVVAAHGKIAFVSSQMGAMSAIDRSGSWLYRASKGGLNVIVKVASVELGPKGVSCFAFHPGWVQTDMGGPTAPVPLIASVEGMRKTIASADQNANGVFFNYDGQVLGW